MQRRQFLKSLAAISALSATPSWAAMGSPKVLGAAQTPQGEYVMAGLDDGGRVLFQTPLPLRGHGFAAHPSKAIAVAFARRPGGLALVVDLSSGDEIARLDISEFGHFYGHGVFTPDAKYLLTTENDLETSEGRIGIWDVAKGYARVDAKPSGGIGPHEMIALSGGGYAVANGGILTDPSSERRKLNLATMEPSLVILDDNLNVKSVHRPPDELHQLSIRHLAETNGRIGIGMQWEGDPRAQKPCVALWEGDGIELIEDSAGHCQDYIGSTAAHRSGELAFTAPRSGELIVMDSAKNISSEPIEGIYGISASPNGYFATANSQTVVIDLNLRTKNTETTLDWDNHLLGL